MTVPLPRYTGAVVYCCSQCWGDLEHEGGDQYWCPACRESFFFTQVALYEDGDTDD